MLIKEPRWRYVGILCTVLALFSVWSYVKIKQKKRQMQTKKSHKCKIVPSSIFPTTITSFLPETQTLSKEGEECGISTGPNWGGLIRKRQKPGKKITGLPTQWVPGKFWGQDALLQRPSYVKPSSWFLRSEKHLGSVTPSCWLKTLSSEVTSYPFICLIPSPVQWQGLSRT